MSVQDEGNLGSNSAERSADGSSAFAIPSLLKRTDKPSALQDPQFDAKGVSFHSKLILKANWNKVAPHNALVTHNDRAPSFPVEERCLDASNHARHDLAQRIDFKYAASGLLRMKNDLGPRRVIKLYH